MGVFHQKTQNLWNLVSLLEWQCHYISTETLNVATQLAWWWLSFFKKTKQFCYHSCSWHVILIYINLAVDGINQLFQDMQIIKFDSLKGLPHQIITAWKWYRSKDLSLDMLLQIWKFFKTLPLFFHGPLNVLSIIHQTHSTSLFYWSMNSGNTGSIQIYTEHIWCCTRYIPKVSEML
jgi:hypothetical protein